MESGKKRCVHVISTPRGSKGSADTDFIMENIQTHSA